MSSRRNMRVRARRQRAALRARLTHGWGAAAKHINLHGRTGTVHSKKTPSGTAQHADSSGGNAAASASAYRVTSTTRGDPEPDPETTPPRRRRSRGAFAV